MNKKNVKFLLLLSLCFLCNLSAVKIENFFSSANLQKSYFENKALKVPINCLLFATHNPNILFVGPYSAPVVRWDLDKREGERVSIGHLKGYEPDVKCFSLNKKEKKIINTLYSNGDLVFIDCSKKELKKFEKNRKKDYEWGYCCFDFNKKNSNYYAQGYSAKKFVRIYRVGKSPKAIDTLYEKDGNGVQCIKFNRKQKHTIAVGNYNGDIGIWKIDHFNKEKREPKKLQTLKSHIDYISCMDWSYKNKDILVSGDSKGNIVVWNLDMGCEVHKIKAHTEIVNDIVFHPTEKNIFFSCSDDNTIKAWNSSTGKCIERCYDHDAKVRCLCIDSKGKRLASGDSNGCVKVSKITFEESDLESSRYF